MQLKYVLQTFLVICTLTGCLTAFAAKPGQFSNEQLGGIWKELWNTKAEPKLEELSEKNVIDGMLGNWIVMFGPVHDRVTISINNNHEVQVSGQTDGNGWKKTGEWRVISNKLVLFLNEDSIPSFVFRTGERYFIFDPWANTMMSELIRGKGQESSTHTDKGVSADLKKGESITNSK